MMKNILLISALLLLVLSCSSESEKESTPDSSQDKPSKTTDTGPPQKETQNSYKLGSSHLEYANFLPQQWLDQMAKVSYPSIFENAEIDQIEVKVNSIKLPGWEHEIAISQVRLYHGDKFENLYILSLPDDNGNFSKEQSYVQNIEDHPCSNCYLLDIALEDDVGIGTFAFDREMTKLEKKELGYNLAEAYIYWVEEHTNTDTSAPDAGDFQLCTSEENSDCYITGIFDKDGEVYINVDFITYEIVPETAGTDGEEYKVINNNPKIRTFKVKDAYSECSRIKKISTRDLVDKAKAAPTTIFSLEARDGVVEELYIDTCSG